MAASFPIKQGATLLLHAQAVQDDGSAIDITDITLAADIRDIVGGLTVHSTVTKTNPTNGQFDIQAQSDSTWPLGQLHCDVVYVNGGIVLFSDTFSIQVTPAITGVPT